MLVVVTLGHRLNDDGSITETMQKRLEMTLQLIDKRMPDAIVVSGGIANKNAGVSEAEVMKKWLVERNVNSNLIIVEADSKNTLQNAKNSVKIAKNIDATEIIVCTTVEHINRLFLNPLKLFKAQLKDTNIKLTSAI